MLITLKGDKLISYSTTCFEYLPLSSGDYNGVAIYQYFNFSLYVTWHEKTGHKYAYCYSYISLSVMLVKIFVMFFQLIGRNYI